MGKTIKTSPSHGAENAFKGITKGTSNSFDVNGCRAGMNKMASPTNGGSDPTYGKTVVGSTKISQHKKLAMTGKV